MKYRKEKEEQRQVRRAAIANRVVMEGCLIGCHVSRNSKKGREGKVG